MALAQRVLQMIGCRVVMGASCKDCGISPQSVTAPLLPPASLSTSIIHSQPTALPSFFLSAPVSEAEGEDVGPLLLPLIVKVIILIFNFILLFVVGHGLTV